MYRHVQSQLTSRNAGVDTVILRCDTTIHWSARAWDAYQRRDAFRLGTSDDRGVPKAASAHANADTARGRARFWRSMSLHDGEKGAFQSGEDHHL